MLPNFPFVFCQVFSPYCGECIGRINAAADMLAGEDLIAGWVNTLQVSYRASHHNLSDGFTGWTILLISPEHGRPDQVPGVGQHPPPIGPAHDGRTR